MKVAIVNTSINELSRQINHPYRPRRSSSFCTHGASAMYRRGNRKIRTRKMRSLLVLRAYRTEDDYQTSINMQLNSSERVEIRCAREAITGRETKRRDASFDRFVGGISLCRLTRRWRASMCSIQFDQLLPQPEYTHIRSLKIMAGDLHLINNIIVYFSLVQDLSGYVNERILVFVHKRWMEECEKSSNQQYRWVVRRCL